MPSPQSTRYVFTLNNPTAVDVDHVRELGQHELCRYLIYGREVGQSGTPHLQGFVVFNRTTRRSRVSGLLPRAHLEIARGTSEQAAAYCKKEGDWVEFGDFPTNNTSNKYLDELYAWGDAFIEEKGRAPTSPEIARAHPTAYLRYPRVCNLFQHRAPIPDLRSGSPRPWQQSLATELDGDPDDRSVLFYVDAEGGNGKSWFQGWYFSNNKDSVQILSIGKRDDLAHAIDPSKKVFFFNVPRGGMQMLQYTILEQLKDRLVFSPKYNSKTKMLSFVPHVVVFCNEEPVMGAMSGDRYIIRNTFD